MRQDAIDETGGPRAVLHPEGLVERPVQIYRDEWGIPHVRAHSVRDAFAGQGYAHAMDRFWQMDASRKQMQGRWAEWVGPAGVAADRLARRLRAAAASVRDYQALGAAARDMVDAYAAGVNAYLATHPAPREYALLATEPEPWEGWHCVAAMRQRGYLMGSVWFKLWRAESLGVVSPDDLVKLRYDDGGSERLCMPPGEDAERWVASLAELREPIGALRMLESAAEVGGGSNNWALAPGRTATGRPILAGDPHRAFEMPGMYAQFHLGCDEFDVIGLTVPGVPGFPHFAHNSRVAWGVTHAFADIHDLYVERFDPASPSRYLHRGEWLSATTTVEEIKVRGAAPVPVQIVETMHGPVVAGDPASGAALTLKSIQFHDVDHSLDCLLPMLAAGSVDDLFLAVRGWGLVDHNLVAADTGGHIGHLVRAVIPRRSAVNGWLPVPGWTGDYEWDGVVPADQMPRVDDPERGYLVTANNRVATVVPATGDYLCTDAHPPYRARRIEELISGLGSASPDDMAMIHRDDLSAPARLFISALSGVAVTSPRARAVRDAVLSWDGRMSPGSAGAACYSRLRWALTRIVGRRSGLADATRTGIGGLVQLPGGPSQLSHLWWVVPGLLRSGDVSLTGGAAWPELLAEALEAVAAEGASADGAAAEGASAEGAPADTPWGRLHIAALTHPLTAALADVPASAGLSPAGAGVGGGLGGPADLSPAGAGVGGGVGGPADLSPAGAGVGGDNDTVWATGCRAESGTAAVYGAIARYVFDVGNWDNCRWIVVGGASGDPASPHYVDQHEAWSKCELIPMRYDWDAVAAVAPQITLEPRSASAGGTGLEPP